MSSEKVPSEEFQRTGEDVAIPREEKPEDTRIPSPELEDSALLGATITTPSSHAQGLATTIYRIGLAQRVFEIFIVGGMGLYLGLVLGEMRRTYDYFGESFDDIYKSWVLFEYDIGCILAAIFTDALVSFRYIFYEIQIFKYLYLHRECL